jgi:hypothetical protein
MLSFQTAYAKENDDDKNLHIKKYNLYGQINIINFRNTQNVTAQLSPGFSIGVNRTLVSDISNSNTKSVRLGLEYAYASYYFNLHYNNGQFDIAGSNIEVLQVTNSQIIVPVIFSYGMPKKNNMITLSAGIFGSYIFGVTEKYKDNNIEKAVSINNGFNKVNVGGEFALGLEHLYDKPVIIQPFSSFQIGSRYSLLGISKNNNLCIPIEAFIRITLF